jgi:hypothetical protein
MQAWLSDLLETKGSDLFRYKGLLAVKGMTEKFLFQGVHMTFTGQFESDILWKDGETRECRFVFIGKDLDQEALKRDFMKCEVTNEPLRFSVGDEIEVASQSQEVSGDSDEEDEDEGKDGAKKQEGSEEGGADTWVETWVKGKVIATWEQGNPYLIELPELEHEQFLVPDDTEQYVRALSNPKQTKNMKRKAATEDSTSTSTDTKTDGQRRVRPRAAKAAAKKKNPPGGE